MTIPSKLVANFFSGFAVLFLLFASSYSDNHLIMGVTLIICSFCGYYLSQIDSENNKKIIWAYGLSYIAVPALFTLSGFNEDSRIYLDIEFIWAGQLAIIYAASLAGGISASKRMCNTGIPKNV